MKKTLFVSLLVLLSLNAYAWNSETGSGVVSDSSNIVRASLEATQVLQSDQSSYLYGVTVLGGTTNYASFDSGGVYDTRNIVSSRDVVKLGHDQYLGWVSPSGHIVRMGVSADGNFVLPAGTAIINSSAETLHVTNSFRSSGNASFVKASFDNASIENLLSSGSANFVRASSDVHSINNLRTSNSATFVAASADSMAVSAFRSSGDANFVRASFDNSNVGNLVVSTSAVLVPSSINAPGAVERVQFTSSSLPVNQVNLYNSNTGVPVRVVASGDDTNIGLTLDAKGTGVVSTDHAFVQKRVTLVDAASIATNASLGNHFVVTLAGNRTLARPSNPTLGQKAIWEIRQDSAGSRTLSTDVAFIFGSDVPVPTLSTGSNKRDFIGAIYNGSSWDVVAVVKGYNG